MIKIVQLFRFVCVAFNGKYEITVPVGGPGTDPYRLVPYPPPMSMADGRNIYEIRE